MVLNRCLHGVVSCWAFEAESWAKVVRHSCDYLHSLGAPINFDASRFVSQFGETQRQFLIFWDCSTYLNPWLDSSSIVAGLWDALCSEGHTVSVVFECTTVTHEQKATLDGWSLSRVEVDEKSFTSLQHSTVFWTTHDGQGSDFVEINERRTSCLTTPEVPVTLDACLLPGWTTTWPRARKDLPSVVLTSDREYRRHLVPLKLSSCLAISLVSQSVLLSAPTLLPTCPTF